MELKKKTLTETTGQDYEQKLSLFIAYLKRESLEFKPIDEFKKGSILKYWNEVIQRNSAKTRNNHRTVLSSLFSVLKENEMVLENPVKEISVEKTKSVRHKTYSEKQLDDLWVLIEKRDKQLLLFIKFVSYNFLRPIEVCRLEWKDLKLEEKQPYLEVRAKNKLEKIKIIPQILFDEIKDMKGDGLVFPTNDLGKMTTEVNRRGNFGKRFKEIKDELNLGEEYTMYSFRHTFVTKLYRELRKTMNKIETENTLMLITGHTTQKALQMYLRDIDAELPKDFSHLLNKKAT